jgi:hypothetical protein
MNFTQEMVESYYLNRLDSWRIRPSKGIEYRSKCPFHGGDNPSALKVWMDDGHFVCFACGTKGNGIDKFEMEMQKSETGVVPEYRIILGEIERLVGTPIAKRVYTGDLTAPKKGFWNRGEARATYKYTDELGDELMTVYRFIDYKGNKKTPQDHPCNHLDAATCDKCEGGRVSGAQGVRRVLYRLPEVIQSLVVFVVEGEKNADDLNRALGTYLHKHGGIDLGKVTIDRIAVTTNMGGAMAWKTEFGYGKYFLGKIVVKLGDNDPQGQEHTRATCADIAKFAKNLYTLDLPVGEGEDISDYLESHTVKEFLQLLAEHKHAYEVIEQKDYSVKGESPAPRQILVKPSELAAVGSTGGDFLVPKLIRKGSRGLVIADPKTGKSLFFLDIALALANCQKVLGLDAYPRPVRVGIISREDGPEMVQDRLYCLARGRGLSTADVDRYIRVNTSAQSSRFKIDQDSDLKEMAAWIRAEQIEFCVVDVLNKLHTAEENSNDAMTRVMQRFDLLAEESGSQICVIHHSNGAGKGRGASSIDGWADYIFRLESDPNDISIKTLSVRTKATGDVKPRQMQYWQSEDLKTSRINLVIPR